MKDKNQPNKNSIKKNSFSKNIMAMTLLTAVLLFGYIYTLEKVKSLSMEKIRKEEELIGKREQLEAQLVEIQQLSSEERIVDIAVDSIGLIRSLKPFETIPVNSMRVKQIKEIIERKYE